MSDDQIDNNDNRSRINASFGELSLEVETKGRDECEDLFNSVWSRMMSDAEEMSESARDRFSKP